MEEQDFQLKEDTLTGLRRLVLHHQSTPEILRENIGNAGASLIYIDVDNLKTFMDYNGLPMGDALLQAITNVLRAVLPIGGNSYRVGGDEFLVVLPHCSQEQAIQIAESIRHDAEQIKLDAYGNWIASSPGITLGIASSNGPAWDAVQLIEQAKEANSKGKSDGKNRVVY